MAQPLTVAADMAEAVVAAFMRQEEASVGRLLGERQSANDDYRLAVRVEHRHGLLGEFAQLVGGDIAKRILRLRQPHPARFRAAADQRETCRGLHGNDRKSLWRDPSHSWNIRSAVFN
jgi:hypothetical protein